MRCNQFWEIATSVGIRPGIPARAETEQHDAIQLLAVQFTQRRAKANEDWIVCDSMMDHRLLYQSAP